MLQPTLNKTLLLILILVTAQPQIASAVEPPVNDDAESSSDWPGLLGRQRNGWAGDFEAPMQWPESARKVWQVDVGTGYGSSLVADGRVYQHARQGEEEVVWCLDLKDGTVLWRESHPVPFKMGGGGERHGKGPKSSPAIADGRVFTMSITGVLSAWDADTGKLLWRRDDGSQFESSHPYWGMSTSPIVDGDLVIVHFGTDDEGVLKALDVRTGEEVWSQGEDGASYASPMVVEIDGVRQVVEWNHNVLAGIDIQSGKQLWSVSFPHVGTNQNMPSPIFHDGKIIVGGENRGVHHYAPSLTDSEWSVEKLWEQDRVALDMSTAIVNDGLLFGFSHYGQGRLFCVDLKTGEILWQGPARTGQNVAFLAIPEHVLALINSGELQVFKAIGDEMQTVATYEVADSETWAPPVLLPEGLLIKDVDKLTLWDLGLEESGE